MNSCCFCSQAVHCYFSMFPGTEHKAGMNRSLLNISSSAWLFKQSKCSWLRLTHVWREEKGACVWSMGRPTFFSLKLVYSESIAQEYIQMLQASRCHFFKMLCPLSHIYLHMFPHAGNSQVDRYTCKIHPYSHKFLHRMCLDSLHTHWYLSEKKQIKKQI